ncbi:unnamed protein product [Lepeophtheirus salmonis]|uniref:(salmon louse) hypothetical protein n=1 Tax=Lepeophtheirus salmonis TaxID=72036 RepID=A0A7R8CFF0_LEPSM|nr:unnamed protein product [Lepeophtheirus salmonis]CAF2805810.1 unnamed protein product [Lepeophtheirus salmonis]
MYVERPKLKSQGRTSQLSSLILIEQMSSNFTKTLMSNSSNLTRCFQGWEKQVNQAPPVPVGRCGYSISHDYRFLKNGEQFLPYDSGNEWRNILEKPKILKEMYSKSRKYFDEELDREAHESRKSQRKAQKPNRVRT